MLLGLTVLVLLLAAWFHFVARRRPARRAGRDSAFAQTLHSPLAIAAWVLVFFEVLSLTLAMTAQYPAWSVGRSNLQALTGKTCGLADDVHGGTGSQRRHARPGRRAGRRRAGRGCRRRLHPNGIPADVSADPVMERPGDRSFVDTTTG